MKRFKQLLIISVFLPITLNALAGSTVPATVPNALSNGFYVEPYLGYGYVDVLANSSRDDGLAGGFAFGYKATDNWAVDIGYTQLPNANVTTYYFYLSLKYILPLTAKWDLFAKMGPGYTHGAENPALSSDSGFTFFAGLGTTYWFRQNIGFVIQSALTTSRDNIPLTFDLTGGLTYFF